MSSPTATTTPQPTIAQVAAAAAAKPIPRSRPTPIAMAGSPAGRAHASPGAASSFRRGGRSVGIDQNGMSFGADDTNWRSRGSEAGSIPGSVPKNGRGPERTVGGFEKREVRAGSNTTSALSVSKDKGDKASALSHVPCRFFKAGACTAGSSCPFSHDVGGKREVCQWFLKGDCKFGHKCALAHVRPGEPMSMDRRNKKEQQREARERTNQDGELGTSPVASLGGAKASPIPTASISHPVPIKSAISASLQSGSLHSPSRFASSPLREPYGPPAAVVAGSPSAGFNHGTGRSLSGAAGFASSPSRPSPLSSSFNARATAVGPTSLKSGSVVAHSPLRPPSSSALFSSSFSHTSVSVDKSGGQLSASFAGGARNIWARSETPDEPLSPARRPINALPAHVTGGDVFDEHDDHGEDLLPSSLSDLLTPTERARRMSRTDSREGYAGSPSRPGFINPNQYVGAERLAQSAGAAMPGNFLEALWSKDGGDARKEPGAKPAAVAGSPGATSGAADISFSPAQPQPSLRQSLLSQQRTPSSPNVNIRQSQGPAIDAPYLMRDRTDPSSPTARALQEHAPGQSLPGGIAAALSRMHMGQVPRASSGLGSEHGVATPPGLPTVRREDIDAHDEEALFHMDAMDS